MYSFSLWFAKGASEISTVPEEQLTWTTFLSLSDHHVKICFSLFFFLVNLQFSNHVMEPLRGLSCGLLYTGTNRTEQMSVYTFRPKATLVHRENHGTLFFVLEGRTCLDVWPVLYLCLSYRCPPSISSCVRLKKHWFIGLAAFLDINSEKKKQISSQRECWFVSILAACQVCNSKPDWIPRWTEAISAGQTDESKASNEISARVCLSGQSGIGELSVKEVFGLDSVSLLLMHKADALFRRPLTSSGRAKPVKQGLSE